MSATIPCQQSFETFEIQKSIDIAAPIEIAFEAMLEEVGPEAQMMNGTPMPFKLEAWPGGRWYRDLGNKSGHLWGHVQVIKPPALLEICGPMMMSYPAMNHIQYRLTAQGSGTHLAFTHRGMGLIMPDHLEGMPQGWGHWTSKIGERAERMAAMREKVGNCLLPQRAPRRGWELAAGALSVGLWAIAPNCPVWLAAHVALWSGLGLSLAAATLLRWSLLGASAAFLLGATLIRRRRVRARV